MGMVDPERLDGAERRELLGYLAVLLEVRGGPLAVREAQLGEHEVHLLQRGDGESHRGG